MKFPTQVRLEAWEETAIIRVRLAKYFSVLPADIDRMSYEDVCMTLAVMNADSQLEEMSRK